MTNARRTKTVYFVFFAILIDFQGKSRSVSSYGWAVRHIYHTRNCSRFAPRTGSRNAKNHDPPQNGKNTPTPPSRRTTWSLIPLTFGPPFLPTDTTAVDRAPYTVSTPASCFETIMVDFHILVVDTIWESPKDPTFKVGWCKYGNLPTTFKT